MFIPNKARTKLLNGIVIKFPNMPRTHTQARAGRQPDTNSDLWAAST